MSTHHVFSSNKSTFKDASLTTSLYLFTTNIWWLVIFNYVLRVGWLNITWIVNISKKYFLRRYLSSENDTENHINKKWKPSSERRFKGRRRFFWGRQVGMWEPNIPQKSGLVLKSDQYLHNTLRRCGLGFMGFREGRETVGLAAGMVHMWEVLNGSGPKRRIQPSKLLKP